MDRRSLLRISAVAGLGGLLQACRGGASQVPVETGTEVERSDAAGPGTGTESAVGNRRIIWSVNTSEPVLTLTFDDGPDPEFTPKVLEILGSHGVRATFNVMGFNAERHADELRATVAASHEIGNHTFSHRDLAFQTPTDTMSELRRGLEAIRQQTGLESVRWFRPPRGELTGVAARYAARLGHDILLWTLLGDTAGHEHPDQVSRFVIPELSAGRIIAFHDGIGRGTFAPKGRTARSLRERRTAEIAALPTIIDAALERGLRFVTTSELAALERPVPA